jgi:VCBS repeat-containing protein
VPSTTTTAKSGNAYVDGVLSGVKWAVSSFTFSFPASASFYGTGYGNGEPASNFEVANSVQQAAVRAALKMYSGVANVTFTEVTESATVHGDLRYAMSDLPSTAWAYYPTTNAAGGDAWFNNSTTWYDNPVSGNYAWTSFIHETGHAMGLKHPHEVSGSFAAEPTDHDSLEYSVMSYRSYIGASTTTGYTNGSTSYPQTLMMLDIAALQQMYGANYTTNAGDTTYQWDSSTGRMSINAVAQIAPAGNKIFMTLWDGGGTDTYNFSNYTTNLKVDLTPGGWTTTSSTQLASLGSGHVAVGNIANALLYNNNSASLIENVIGGTGNDTILGNTANNKVTGGAGNDTIDGGAGTNTAVYSGAASSYTQVHNLDGSWTVTDLRLTNGDGTDTLKNIQYLQFSDKTVATGTTGVVVPTVNHAPVATTDSYGAVKNTTLTVSAANGVLSNDTDADANTLKAVLVSGPSIGKLTLNADGSFVYKPSTNFTGSVTFKYKANDGSLDSATTTVTIKVAKVAAAQTVGHGNVPDLSDDQMPIALSDHSSVGARTTGDFDWTKLAVVNLAANAAASTNSGLAGLSQIEQILAGLDHQHGAFGNDHYDDHGAADATGLPDFLHAFYAEFALA